MRLVRSTVLVLVAVLLVVAPAWASAESDIQAANAQGKAVFVVVTQSNARGTDRALAIAQQAQALHPMSAVVTIDRAVAENQSVVQRYRLQSAPVPLLLVVASNGIVAGGARLQDATPQRLVASIPTPKKAEMLLNLTQKKPVFIVVSSKAMVEARGQVFEACNTAMKRLDGKAVTLVVDMADKAEAAWLKELKISPKEKAPVTIVYNAKAQKTKVFRGTVTADQLFKAATQKAACCPGGSC